MISQIVADTIDENFPVAGQDNDSQGFRDNFSIIKTALQEAKTELTDLRNNSARKDTANDFDNNDIANANFISNTLEANTTFATGVTEDSKLVSWAEGYVHVIRSDVPALTLTITDIPPSNYMQMRLILTASVSSVITITTTFGSAGIKTDESVIWSGNSITVNSATNPRIVEIFTYNGGATLYMRNLGLFE